MFRVLAVVGLQQPIGGVWTGGLLQWATSIAEVQFVDWSVEWLGCCGTSGFFHSFASMLRFYWLCINGLVQDCSISSALALGILQSCTKPLVWLLKILVLASKFCPDMGLILLKGPTHLMFHHLINLGSRLKLVLFSHKIMIFLNVFLIYLLCF